MAQRYLRTQPRESEAQHAAGSRALVGATLAVGLLYLMGIAATGTPPAASETGQDLVDWLRSHHLGIQWSVWANTVAVPFFACMIARLRRLLPAPHRDVYFIGALMILITGIVQSWTWAGLALHAQTVAPATARTVLDVAVFWGPVLTGATITMMAPVTVLALQGRIGLPRWLGALGAIAVLEQAIETITIFGSTGFTQPGGAMNLQLGAGLVVAWVLAFGIWGGLKGQVQDAAV